MPKTIVYSPKVAKPVNPHSQATLAGNHFYAATVALDVNAQVVGIGDLKAQTRRALQNLVWLLEAAGARSITWCG
jgi:enamine deaminase RidA (YjgF/YER057c/UK114 family)